jgi:hypothetical protein
VLDPHLEEGYVGPEVGRLEFAEFGFLVLGVPHPVYRGLERLDRLPGFGVLRDLDAGRPSLSEGGVLGGD